MRDEKFTIFSFGNYVICFKAPYSLEKYKEIKEWDNGDTVIQKRELRNNRRAKWVFAKIKKK